MDNILSEAFSILITGMITVMIILGLVVGVGTLLIGFTNRFWPVDNDAGKNGSRKGAIPPGTLAAIIAAVDSVTGGKGKITKIEKE
jgi:oxaloacetate decarboxylase (Na+ extruding) subunit gamma